MVPCYFIKWHKVRSTWSHVRNVISMVKEHFSQIDSGRVQFWDPLLDMLLEIIKTSQGITTSVLGISCLRELNVANNTLQHRSII